MTGDKITDTESLVGAVDLSAGMSHVAGGQRLRDTCSSQAAYRGHAATMEGEVLATHPVEKGPPRCRGTSWYEARETVAFTVAALQQWSQFWSDRCSEGTATLLVQGNRTGLPIDIPV